MRNVLDILSPDSTSDEQSLRVAQAYAALFTGQGSLEDAELVLVDMGIFVRYGDTAMLSTPAETLQAISHRQAPFMRVLDAMTRMGVEPIGLRRAVQSAPPIDAQEETTE